MSSSPSQRMKIGEYPASPLQGGRRPSDTCSAFPATVTSNCCSSFTTLAR
jgi:hypothetical protein